MNYLSEERRNALAAEFVLGTLRGGARRRYQQLMMQHQLVRETTWVWEQYINVLGHKLEPKVPSEQVWLEVSQRLGFENELDGSSKAAAQTKDKIAQLKPRVTRFWQGLATLATAAAIILAVILVQFKPWRAPSSQFAVVQSEKAQALWLIEVSDEQIKIKATDKLPAQVTNDYELWFVAADGRAPVSLGLMPQSGEIKLAKSSIFSEADLAVLAVSLEPLGGSPNGSPTKVLYTSELVTL